MARVLSFNLPFEAVAKGSSPFSHRIYQPQRLKSNQNSTDTLLPGYSFGSGLTGFDPWIARIAEASTDAFPLDCKI